MSGAGDARHVVLMGLMGSGKSTVGSALARRLGRSFSDSDVEIEAATGLTVRELAEREGVDGMHDREARHLLDALASAEPKVIAAAASTIERDDCRAALRSADALVVYIDVATDVLVQRFASRSHRPQFGLPVEELLAGQRTRRGPLFEAAASLVVDGADADVDRLVATVERALCV